LGRRLSQKRLPKKDEKLKNQKTRARVGWGKDFGGRLGIGREDPYPESETKANTNTGKLEKHKGKEKKTNITTRWNGKCLEGKCLKE
jgi:hypothetical protein